MSVETKLRYELQCMSNFAKIWKRKRVGGGSLHYITLHYIALHYITLHYITLSYITDRVHLVLILVCMYPNATDS